MPAYDATVTYVLSVATDRFVHHASDRLTTKRYRKASPLREWEKAANKTVLFFGQDGCFVLGYSGTAYLDGWPTDHFIAQSLRGHPIPVGRMSAHDRSGHPDDSVGYVLLHLKSDLDAALTRHPNEEIVQQFYLTAAGWQHTHSGHFYSFIWRLTTHSGPPLTIDLRPGSVGHVLIDAAPSPAIGRDPTAALIDELALIHNDPLATADLLASEIRRASDFALDQERELRIGRDVMTVSLGPPGPGETWGVVRARPDPKVSRPDVPSPLYTPWAIEPLLTQKPRLMTGSAGIGSNLWIPDLQGLTPRSGIVMTQPRRTETGPEPDLSDLDIDDERVEARWTVKDPQDRD